MINRTSVLLLLLYALTLGSVIFMDSPSSRSGREAVATSAFIAYGAYMVFASLFLGSVRIGIVCIELADDIFKRAATALFGIIISFSLVLLT
jgi:hypothetical protein